MARKLTPLTVAQLVGKIQRAIDKGELVDAQYSVDRNMVTLKYSRGRHGKIQPGARAVTQWALDKLAPHVHDIQSAQVGRVRPLKASNGRERYDQLYTSLHLDNDRYGVRLYVDVFELHEHTVLMARSDQLDSKGRPKWYCLTCGQAVTLAEQRRRNLL